MGTAMQERDITATLTARALAIRYASLPQWVRHLAGQCLIDWFAVAIAGAPDRLVQLLLDEARAEGGHPVASVPGHRDRVTRNQAALVNGTMSHVLDYDDVNLNINGHPSAVLAPALLAVGEVLDARGDELLAAFVAGYEFACRAGRLIAPGHYLKGYHATATVGSLGAALACAHLLGLDAERTQHAVGIAASQAAGLKGLFGTECKPFHAGMAAQNGVRAAALAARGMMSRPDALECRQGFAAVMSPDFDPAAALGEPERFYISENLFKYHAACYGTHSAIECARQLIERQCFAPDAIQSVKVRVEKGADAVCNIATPRTGLEAKFSLRLTTAMALSGRDTGDLATYTEAVAAEPALVALRDRTSVELVEGWPLMQTEVIVRLNDGRQVQAQCDTGVPSTDFEAQAERIAQKFTRLTRHACGRERSDRLLETLRNLAECRVRGVMALAAGQPS